MPLNNMLEVENFYVWDIDFMGPFPSSCGNLYIFLVIDYVSKWVEASNCYAKERCKECDKKFCIKTSLLGLEHQEP